MSYRERRLRTRRRSSRSEPFRKRYTATVFETLPQRRDDFRRKPFGEYHGTTRPVRRSEPRQDPLYSPYSQTVLRRRFPETVGAFVRDVRRYPLLGSARRTPGRRNVCSKRAARKSVLFAQRLIGFSGSSPGKNHKYRRNVESEYSCK